MKTEKNKNANSDHVDWHSGFEGGLRLSFRKYEADIDIEREHPLSMEPLKIDFLIVKKKADIVIDNSTPGVYLIKGLIDVPLQIVVIKELDDAEARSLKIMTKNAQDIDVKAFLEETRSFTTAADKRYADAVLQVSAKVNKALYNVLKGDSSMCEALREIMADELKEAEDKGENKGEAKINTLYSWLFDLGRAGDVERGSKDPEFLKKLLKEYEENHSAVK